MTSTYSASGPTSNCRCSCALSAYGVGAWLPCSGCSAGRDAGDSTHRSNMTYGSGTELDSEMLHNLSTQTSSLALSSRPASAAVQHLRGSRPNSAAIAATIEGFDNDFLVRPWQSPGKMRAHPHCMHPHAVTQILNRKHSVHHQ
jgi:hypothetical protein